MFRKALLGLWVSCVCAALSISTFASATDIVLYAGDATNLRGNWSLAADSSAAGGHALTSTDKGWANTTAAQASPADSFDFVFSAIMSGLADTYVGGMLTAGDTDPTTPYFWYEPIANVSPDGRWVLFTSNWEKTLGADSSERTFRQDVFLVQLIPQ